jgi:hypothetical protein
MVHVLNYGDLGDDNTFFETIQNIVSPPEEFIDNELYTPDEAASSQESTSSYLYLGVGLGVLFLTQIL